MSNEKTVVNVCGMNFYIIWENDNEGYDDRGIKWINKTNPECTNPKAIDACLDFFNGVSNYMNKQNNTKQGKVQDGVFTNIDPSGNGVIKELK